jgi:hypothetical protein
MDYQVPPPGYVPPRRHKTPQSDRITVTEVVRTAAKLGDGYNKAQSLHALAAIAQEIRKLILE